ncbi:50S ribosomal protein L24 [Candidatus Roizmanbacteria bacterium]|nr:50S ribosomal protein L24 [Candidatus Roizmanbacteria bacterium]
MKLKKGDQIIVTAGKEKGKKGKIDRIVPASNAVIVAGLNLYKRHVKRRDEKHPGGIIDIARPLPAGNIALICPRCKLPTRIGFMMVKEQKNRMCKKCKQTL